MQKPESTPLADMIQRGAERQGGVYGLDDMLEFVNDNDIADIAALDEHFKGMIHERENIGNALKPIDRKIAELDEHIKQSGIYQQYESYKKKHDKLNAEHKKLSKEKGFGAKCKAEKALETANHYYETNRMEITLCTTQNAT